MRAADVSKNAPDEVTFERVVMAEYLSRLLDPQRLEEKTAIRVCGVGSMVTPNQLD